ncbi:hypothetical protein [Mycobacterium persicum]|uniref:hypothetical protein n=1 Tax=Mycobacterium persicum TaxID=1487726 RepID=UPI0015931A58|nr:hypothetical protein [Mycobacterium persicum]
MSNADVLTLIEGDAETLARVATDDDAYAGLLHGLLALYDRAAHETRTPLGQVALGALVATIAEGDADPDIRRAGHLILAYGGAVAAREDDGDCYDCAAVLFNDVIDAAGAIGRANELLAGVAHVWRRVLPELHTPEGLAALRHIWAGSA